MLKYNTLPGETVQHILQREWVLVLSVSGAPGSAQIVKCRTKKLEEVEFYSFELEHVPSHPRRVYSKSLANTRKE